MKKNTCSILFKCCDEKKAIEILTIASNVIGFEPDRMDVFFHEFSNKKIEDARYDKGYLFSLLEKSPGSITIKNMIYDEDNRDSYCWFRMNIDSNEYFEMQSCSVAW